MIIEERVYKFFMKYYSAKGPIISKMVEAGKSSEQIAIEIAGPKVILGGLVLLAANHMKKTGIRLR
jgi:hypothetical protein